MCTVTAVDISADALRVAEQNVRGLDLANVTCLEGDWTTPVKEQEFNLIVSNPPYVEADHPNLEHLALEPQMALVAGGDGLSAIRVLARDSASVLKDGGAIILEHGCDQQREVASILTEQGWLAIECYKDYAGLPRATVARKKDAS